MDPLTVEDLNAEVGRLANARGRGLVLNVNAHSLNLCWEDPGLRRFLNGADVVFCDGAGVMLAARILGGRIPVRITYADYAWQLAAFAASEGLSLFFLGSRPGVARAAAQQVEAAPPRPRDRRRPSWLLRPLRAGSPENEAVVREINAAAPDILLVGLGMPLQERWLMQNRPEARRRRRPGRRRRLRLRLRAPWPGGPASSPLTVSSG